MPRAVISSEFVLPEAYALIEQPAQPVKAGQARVAIKAAGISFVDVLTAKGEYQVKPPLPFISGSEATDIITEIAEDVTGFKIGDRVVCGGWGGMFAEEIVLPQRALRLVPD